jgi:hypothetical protein
MSKAAIQPAHDRTACPEFVVVALKQQLLLESANQ